MYVNKFLKFSTGTVVADGGEEEEKTKGEI